jgi:peptidoglycan/LPS O-acetylase OafA/YrhL
MISALKKYVIGGRSGKREAGWLLMLLWLIAAVFIVVLDVFGYDMEKPYDLIEFTFYPVIAFLFGAYGMEWTSAQSPWSKQNDDVDYQMGG